MNDESESRIARTQLRQRLLQQRAGIDATTRRNHDAAIVERLHRNAVVQASRVLALYWPIQGEPDLAALVAPLRALGKRLALPVVGGPNRGLLFCAWDADTELVIGHYGIANPRERIPLLPDGLVIPCVGFRLHAGRLYRLGFGAGYYDRTLAHRPVPSVGVGYDVAETADFTPNPSDEPLSSMVTPSREITSIASP
ncbi:MAG: 5-formyltetrahydrofolate cyclo-ligase [Lautropia sp.]